MAKILIVDDSSNIRSLLRMQLKLEGHEVIEAENGALGRKNSDGTRPRPNHP